MLLTKQNPPLRQRRQRTNFNEEAIERLDEAFNRNPYPDINEREQLAKELKTTEDRIQVWFQNKRARFRKRITKKKENPTKKQIRSTNDDDEKENRSSTPISIKPNIDSENTKTPITQLNDISKVSPNISYDSAYQSQLYSSPLLSTSSFSTNSSPSINSFNTQFSSLGQSTYGYYQNKYQTTKSKTNMKNN